MLLLPELEQIVPDARPERPDPSIERYLLYEMVSDLLRSESNMHPMLVVLDDLHWADAPSLRMIEHVLRHEHAGRVMVVATARVPADEPTPDLDRLAAGLARDGLCTRIPVGGLETAAVAELLRANGRAEDRAEDLQVATAGNAFFLTELIRHTEGGFESELPESIKAMIGSRLDRLDPTVTQVINLTALAGQAGTLPVLVAASGLDADRLLDATDAAVAAGLVVEDGAGRLGMPHALIRQAIRERLGRTRVLDLHRRLAEAVEHASERQSSPALLAHHLFEAGSLVERQRRVAAGLAAVRHGLDIGAYEDAASWVARVDALLTEKVDIRDRVELALLSSDTWRALGDREAAIEAARVAASRARRSGEPMLLARSAEMWMMSMSGVGFDIGRPADPELVELMEEAIATLPAEERQYHVRMRSMLASVLVPSPDRHRREELADEALAIAEADGDPELVASAYLARRLALWQLDHLAERTQAVLRAVREAGRTTNAQLELTTMLFALTDLTELGRLDEQRAMLARFRARAAELHLPLFEVYAEFGEASHQLSAGNYDEADRLATAALAKGIRSHGVNAEVAYAGLRYRIALDRGQLADRIPEAEQMVARLPRLRMWQIALVRALVAADRHDEARPVFEELVGHDEVHIRDNQMFLPATCTLAEVVHELGDRERADVLRRTLEPYASRIAVSGLAGISIGPVSGYVGIAAHTSGDLAAAERWLRTAISVDVRFGLHPYEARARQALAAVLRERGAPGDAEQAAVEEAAAAAIAGPLGLALPVRA